MKLIEIFNHLAYEELSQLNVLDASGKINPTKYEQLTANINLGLVDLYMKFNLKVGKLNLVLNPTLTVYPLFSLYAKSNTRSKAAIKYIDDLDNKFTDDILKINYIFADNGNELPFNDLTNPLSIRTTAQRVLSVPESIVTKSDSLPSDFIVDYLQVCYRASHPKIIVDDGDIEPEEVELELPETHAEALIYYIASRMHTPRGTETENNIGNLYLKKYLNICNELSNNGYEIGKDTQYNRFTRLGWI